MTRRCRAGPALVVALAVVLAGCPSRSTLQSTPSTTAGSGAVPIAAPDATTRTLTIGVGATAATTGVWGDDRLAIGGGAIDTWNGWLPDGHTFSPFDTASQPVARLDPLLLKAIQDATRAAEAQGIDIGLTSGWRSMGFQQRLFEDAVRQYGSVDVARRFVSSPDVSRHVVGEAVDITGAGASNWLIRNGLQFGLCQIYANENWHFELAVDADGRCPPLRPNAAG